MTRFVLITGILWLLITNALYAQVTDSLTLDEIRISATRIYTADRYQPVSVSRVDSGFIRTFPAFNAAEVLAARGPIFVRSNGLGGLATFSQRGYSSSQTQVLWNGFQLNHPMLGLTDLSIIPASILGNVTIASGNGSSAFGDRGGGTVALTERTVDGTEASVTTGSFGLTQTEIGVSGGDDRLRASVYAVNTARDNDFTYTINEFSNEAGGFIDVERQREHNRVEQTSLIANLAYQEGESSFISSVWASRNENQIPGSIQSPDSSFQFDEYLRWMNAYQTRINEQHTITAKAYLNRQTLDFFDPSSDIESTSLTTSVLAEAEVKSKLSNTTEVISVVQAGYLAAESSNFGVIRDRTQFALGLQLIQEPVRRFRMYSSARFDHFSDFDGALSGSFGLNLELLPNILFLKGQVSRNFIAPTFNDLYWPGLGNPDIQPETNIKAEGSLLVRTVSRFTSASLEFTAYTGFVDGAIRWLPGGDGLFRPDNLESLSLRGFEVKSELAHRTGDARFSWFGEVYRNVAIIDEPRFEGDLAEGNQLIYTPEWLLKSGLGISYRVLSSQFTYAWTGERFSSSDHQSIFDPLGVYEVSNWTTSLRLPVGLMVFTPQFGLYNVFDERYQVILNFPDAGRNWMARLTLHIPL
ncbi:MAG: TonB-dependent receptor plug domain-containing protein [Bacteroidota bacterium]